MTLPFQDLAAPVAPKTRLALCIDGENLSAALAGQIITRALGFGQPAIRRVYGNAAQLPQWDAAPGFRLVHSGKGKNATDLLLTVEAMALIHDGLADALVIASSDRDFSHLATHLRERGTPVIGMGEAKTNADFRKACTKFIELGQGVVPKLKQTEMPPLRDTQPPSLEPSLPAERQLRDRVADLLKKHGDLEGWVAVAVLGGQLNKTCDIGLKAAGHTKWLKFLQKFSAQFELDASPKLLRVRLRQG